MVRALDGQRVELEVLLASDPAGQCTIMILYEVHN